ncbi:radical SAM family heme chaperone HemW [Streptosporangium sp. NBC_01755]|uniref:radical SAM family heme chaperone HemW n=1 Tax=unclassified Streptosporangium TaxID=2632669 RepID=UPI002DDAA062|nr:MULTISPECIES: radical SAM family heme chaperone HemW [unclassified Streptosporangium]WSA23391.1 radical SAM family heme chaperone HemW [Streptosporangium sp. NBC_01810]WSC98469.1 radical SAM family heme chaperone HemW [Streptosporangium sp. NBC_01755]
MPSTLPDGDPVPASGELPESALAGLGERPFGFYVHVPFCVTRCGYCDFNTYTASELGPGASQRDYGDTAVDEVRRARANLGAARLPVETVFFGGGTPTLLPAGDLVRILGAIEEEFGLAPGAEVTTEANPESVDPAYLAELRAGGFNRMSFGMQSAREHVLAVLDRRHTPGRPALAVREARQAGFEHVNLDLIYSTPGESDDDWRASLAAAIEAGPDHVSAYSLIVEDGTRLAARIRRGELPMPDDDVAADRYLIADAMLAEAGFEWYEVSNWATSEAGRCRHNLLYWTGGDWWGVGPGAHSHVGGTRWWNVKHPAAYARRLAAGTSPAHAREVLGPEDRAVERLMLELRLAQGFPLRELERPRVVARALADGLLETGPFKAGQAVLTLRGRLLADALVRDLT